MDAMTRTLPSEIATYHISRNLDTHCPEIFERACRELAESTGSLHEQFEHAIRRFVHDVWSEDPSRDPVDLEAEVLTDTCLIKLNRRSRDLEFKKVVGDLEHDSDGVFQVDDPNTRGTTYHVRESILYSDCIDADEQDEPQLLMLDRLRTVAQKTAHLQIIRAKESASRANA